MKRSNKKSMASDKTTTDTRASRQSKLARALGSVYERLEMRRLMSANPIYVDNHWKVTVDADHNGVPSAGDTVQNSLQGDDGSITATFGTNAFSSLPQALSSGQ